VPESGNRGKKKKNVFKAKVNAKPEDAQIVEIFGNVKAKSEEKKNGTGIKRANAKRWP